LVTIAPIPDAAPESTPIPPASEPEEWGFAIGGMHCASCVGRVENALRTVPGVRDARVNLATERASVVVDPTLTASEPIERAVAAAGYSAARDELTVGQGAASLKRERGEKVAYWRNRLIVGVALVIPLVALVSLPADRLLGSHAAVGWAAAALAATIQGFLGGP
jgi:Cu+-exporting ATPase